MKLARLHKNAAAEPYWHVQLAMVVAIGLQLLLSSKLTLGPKYAVPGAEILLLVLLTVLTSRQHAAWNHVRRTLATLLIVVVSAANISSLALIIHDLLSSRAVTGKQLLVSALAIYLTNIIIFGLWYWELDDAEAGSAEDMADFFFPQNQSAPRKGGWTATFFDYLYVSITNASAFSPTDTMPLTHRAKALMAAQSLISLITIALVAARAVNILA